MNNTQHKSLVSDNPYLTYKIMSENLNLSKPYRSTFQLRFGNQCHTIIFIQTAIGVKRNSSRLTDML